MQFEFYREKVQIGTQTHEMAGTKPIKVPVFGELDWRWRLFATNGKKLANPGEGYKNFGDMLKSLRSIFGDSPKRCRELDKALRLWEKEHGRLPKPFTFYTGA